MTSLYSNNGSFGQIKCEYNDCSNVQYRDLDPFSTQQRASNEPSSPIEPSVGLYPHLSQTPPVQERYFGVVANVHNIFHAWVWRVNLLVASNRILLGKVRLYDSAFVRFFARLLGTTIVQTQMNGKTRYVNQGDCERLFQQSHKSKNNKIVNDFDFNELLTQTEFRDSGKCIRDYLHARPQSKLDRKLAQVLTSGLKTHVPIEPNSAQERRIFRYIAQGADVNKTFHYNDTNNTIIATLPSAQGKWFRLNILPRTSFRRQVSSYTPLLCCLARNAQSTAHKLMTIFHADQTIKGSTGLYHRTVQGKTPFYLPIPLPEVTTVQTSPQKPGESPKKEKVTKWKWYRVGFVQEEIVDSLTNVHSLEIEDGQLVTRQKIDASCTETWHAYRIMDFERVERHLHQQSFVALVL